MRLIRKASVTTLLGLSAFNARAGSPIEYWHQVPAPPESSVIAQQWWGQDAWRSSEVLSLLDQLEAEREQLLALSRTTVADRESTELQISYARYQQQHGGDRAPDVLLGKRTRWLQAAMGGRLAKLLAKITPCPSPCTDSDLVARNAPHEARKQELLQQDLKQWGALFADWKGKRTALLRRGELETQEPKPESLGEKSRRAYIAYRRALLKEVELLLSVTELAVKRNAQISMGKVDAVTGASRSAAAK